MSNESHFHQPVLLNEVIQALDIKPYHTYIDATFGRGGYTTEILKTESTKVWAIDRDPSSIQFGQTMVHQYKNRLHLIQGRFSEMASLLKKQGIEEVDGVVMDLGLSSPQLDNPDRGFSFRFEGPLDMRMEQNGETAADVVNSMPEDALADIIYQYGEERFSRRIARKIVETRQTKLFSTTKELKTLIASVVPRSKDGLDPATRTFQALRIYVNDELTELEQGLIQAESLLKSKGRLVIVSFHSLEDRCVKNFLRTRAKTSAGISRHAPDIKIPIVPSLKLINRQAIQASVQESGLNPRARSAKLRIAYRL